MGPIAVLGAGGYVGASLIEALVLDGQRHVRAVVRAPRNLASLCRFGTLIETKLADAEDFDSLQAAIAGCHAVVNLVTGPPTSIVRSTEAIYRACVATDVKRLVHMSSAVVFGDVTSASLADDSPPICRHWMPYARAKAASENWLRGRLRTGSLSIAVLRPGIVWGRVFNSIYIENLISCIRACCDHAGDIHGFYNIADEEHLTWRDFYEALAGPLDFDIARIANIPGDRLPRSAASLFEYVQSMPFANGLYHRLKAVLPDTVKAAIKSRLAGAYSYEQIATDYVDTPTVRRELWHLQKIAYKLPTEKFRQQFGFSPPVSFDEGIRRTLNWLMFLGYAPHQASLTH
ncbi:MAG: NAD(P)-dependent oxidoreductase [Planctomycetes bacterium]|nr:NAD(P)-dependent oxidoreductase [Planctomycetota bacterium]